MCYKTYLYKKEPTSCQSWFFMFTVLFWWQILHCDSALSIYHLFEANVPHKSTLCLTQLHSEWPKLNGVLAILSAIGLNLLLS